MISDINPPKFICFIFESNDEHIINGNLTIPLILPEILIKNSNYILVGGICSPSDIHFTSFLYNYQEDCFDLYKGENYYYDGKENNGGIIKINNLLDYITNKNPYLLMYMKK